MKTCSYCGRDNEQIREHCFECGTELQDVSTSLPASITPDIAQVTCVFCGAENGAGQKRCLVCGNELSLPEHPAEDSFLTDSEAAELPTFGLEYHIEHGFSHPDWDKLWHQVKAQVLRASWDAIYRRAAREWLRQLRKDLGGNYRCYETRRFLLLCAEGRRVSDVLLDYAEKSQEAIAAQLGKLMEREVYGKQVLLVFSEDDDYYTYISRYYPDGTHNLSAGVFLPSGGYSHIAMPFTFVFSAKQVITHELVHNSLFHLRVPTWLNEGLAQRIESNVVGRTFGLDREMARRHREFWNSENIQKFWAGVSFHEPGESGELSYSLGLILVELLVTDYVAFLDFVGGADWRDGGQDAAVRMLDKDLGIAAGGFLGEGEWRPNRKRIAELLVPSA